MNVVSMEAGPHHIGKDRPNNGNLRRLRRCKLATWARPIKLITRSAEDRTVTSALERPR
jgi:hypothetical protein